MPGAVRQVQIQFLGAKRNAAFPKGTWRDKLLETAPEQSCHSPHHSALPHRGLVPSRPRFQAPEGSVDG